jgi:hypothetical protein
MSSPGTPFAAVKAAPEKANLSTTIVVPRRTVSTMRLLRPSSFRVNRTRDKQCQSG